MRVLIAIALLLFSCSEPTLPKPKGFLALEYPNSEYKSYQSDCNVHFEINRISEVYSTNGCDFEIQYPSMKATLFVTHISVQNNLESLYQDVQKKLDEQSMGSTRILQSTFEDIDRNVLGSLFTIEADVASNLQFFVTDTQNNFVSGSVYLKTQPNYDSLLPTLEYLKNDIRKLIQTFEWK